MVLDRDTFSCTESEFDLKHFGWGFNGKFKINPLHCNSASSLDENDDHNSDKESSFKVVSLIMEWCDANPSGSNPFVCNLNKIDEFVENYIDFVPCRSLVIIYLFLYSGNLLTQHLTWKSVIKKYYCRSDTIILTLKNIPIPLVSCFERLRFSLYIILR